MGGRLEPEETPGGGLTMVLSLRVSGAEGESTDGASNAAGNSAGRRTRSRGTVTGDARVTRVLVVDDEPQLLPDRELRRSRRARADPVSPDPGVRPPPRSPRHRLRTRQQPDRRVKRPL